MSPDFRRGAAAIEKAQEDQRSGGGDFRPFAPQIFWGKDNADRYLLFLNSIDDIPTVNAITFIPQTKKKANGDTYKTYEQVIARTDPAIGENNDPMEDNWDGKVRATSIAVAVELEVETEEVNGRQRPVGFRVATNEFERRVRGDDGELTDEKELVIAPAVGFVTQSPNNFFNVIAAYDANEAPINETPIKITRLGKDKNTTYTPTGYPGQPVDLTDLLDNVEFISYLGDDADKVIDAIATVENDFEAATVIGNALLDKRLTELCDKDYYDGIYDGITETLDPWSKKGKSSEKSAPKRAASRRDRPSQRKSNEETSVDEPSETDNVSDETPEDKPKSARRPRVKSDSSDSTSAQLQKLKERARKAKAEAAE